MSACSVGDAGDTGSIPGLGRSPGRENGNPNHTIILVEWARGALHSYSLKGCKVLDATEQLSTQVGPCELFICLGMCVCVCVCVCVY